MARADILLSMVQSVNRNDMISFRKSVESLIAEERAKKHNILADRLAASINENGSKKNVLFLPNGVEKDLVFEVVPQKRFEDLIINTELINVLIY